MRCDVGGDLRLRPRDLVDVPVAALARHEAEVHDVLVAVERACEHVARGSSDGGEGRPGCHQIGDVPALRFPGAARKCVVASAVA